MRPTVTLVGVLAFGVAVLTMPTSCTNPTGPGAKKLSRFDSLSQSVVCGHKPCKDTLTGWVHVGLDQGKTPYGGSHLLEIKALGRTLFVRNNQGDIYFRQLEGKWQKLELGEMAAIEEAMLVEGEIVYLLTNSGKIFSVDKSGNKTFLEQVPDSLACQLKNNSPCFVTQIYRYRNQFFIVALQQENHDNFQIFRDSLLSYHLSVGQNGIWKRMQWQNDFRVKANLSFRTMWMHGDSILGGTFEDGIWIYDGNKWDSLPIPKSPHYYTDPDGNRILLPDSIRNVKLGSVAIFQNELFAGNWPGQTFKWNGTNFEMITMRSITLYKDTMVWDGYLKWGFDTICGHLFDVHGVVRWKPGMLGWKEVLDTNQTNAFKGFTYPISDAFSLVRVGDSLFTAYQAPINVREDSVPGGVAMFNLRNAQWCEDAWKRGEVDRGGGIDIR